MNHSVCIECHEDKPLAEFYSYKNNTKHYRKCKVCHNKNLTKYQKRPKGFAKLSADLQNSIKQAVAIRQNTLKEIAAQFQLNYSSLCYWSRESHIL